MGHSEINRTKRFFYSTLTTALYQFALLVAGFITPKVMLVYYGSEVNGLVSSLTQFIAYFNLVEAGLSGATIYALYKPLAESNFAAISSVVVAAKRLYYRAGYLFLVLLAALAIGYPLVVSSSMGALDVGLLVFILGMGSILEFFTLAKYRALLTADQKTYVISVASTVHVVINTLVIVVLARFGVSIVILRAVALLSVFVRTAILVLYVKRKYSYVDYGAEPDNSAMDKRWDAVYMQVLGAVHAGAPIIILTFIVNDLYLVSVFSIYSLITTGLYGLMSIFSSGLSAGFGNVIANGEIETLKESYQQFEVGYLAIMTAVYSTAFATIVPFVQVYTAGITDANYIVPTVGALIVINAFLYNLKSPQAMLLIAAGLYKESRIQTTIQGLLAVVLGCALGYFWGVEGILIASIVSNLYRCVDLLFFIPKHVTHLRPTASLCRWVRMAICFGLVSVASCFIPVLVTNYAEWTVLAAVYAVVSLAISLSVSAMFDFRYLRGLLVRLRSVFK